MKIARKHSTSTVPVGRTPVSKYANWDDHRRAIRRESEAARASRTARRKPRRARA